jgi:hypothetical protein
MAMATPWFWAAGRVCSGGTPDRGIVMGTTKLAGSRDMSQGKKNHSRCNTRQTNPLPLQRMDIFPSNNNNSFKVSRQASVDQIP